MKKISTVILSIMLILLSTLSVCATRRDPDSTFVIDELEMSIYVPSHYVATRTSTNFDMDPENYEEALKDFEQKDIYLWGYSKFYNEEIFLYAIDSNVKSLSHFNEEGLEEVADNIKGNLEAHGYVISKSETYESHNATYILTHYYDTEENYAISYSTVNNYKDIVLTMWSYGSEPTANQRKDLLFIINTIEFGTDIKTDETTSAETGGIDNNIQNDVYDDISDLVSEKDVMTIGIAVIVIIAAVVLTLIAGAVVAIILVTKAKKRRRLAAQQATTSESAYNTKFCTSCGEQTSPNDAFCFKCGANQSETIITDTTDKQ